MHAIEVFNELISYSCRWVFQRAHDRLGSNQRRHASFPQRYFSCGRQVMRSSICGMLSKSLWLLSFTFMCVFTRPLISHKNVHRSWTVGCLRMWTNFPGRNELHDSLLMFVLFTGLCRYTLKAYSRGTIRETPDFQSTSSHPSVSVVWRELQTDHDIFWTQ